MENKEVLENESGNDVAESKETKVEKEIEKDTESLEIQKYKRQLSEYATEISKYKKMYKDKLSEEEKAEAERKEKLESMENELNALRREKDITSQKAEYIAMGFEADLAKETAEALVNGDFATVNRNLKKHFEDVKKQAIADEIMNTPSPSISGSNSKSLTADDIFAIKDTDARRKAIEENLELFTE